MGRNYVPVYEGDTESDGTVTVSPERVQMLGVRTEAAREQVLSRSIRAVGTPPPTSEGSPSSAPRFEGVDPGSVCQRHRTAGEAWRAVVLILQPGGRGRGARVSHRPSGFRRCCRSCQGEAAQPRDIGRADRAARTQRPRRGRADAAGTNGRRRHGESGAPGCALHGGRDAVSHRRSVQPVGVGRRSSSRTWWPCGRARARSCG